MPLSPGSFLSELSREVAESISFCSGGVLDGIGAMPESLILGINEKQALQVTVIANQSTVGMVPAFIHIMCHNKCLLKKDSTLRIRENRPGGCSAGSRRNHHCHSRVWPEDGITPPAGAL